MKDFTKAVWKTAPIGEVAQIRPNKREAKSVLADEDDVSFVPMDCLKVDQVGLAEHEARPLGKVYGGYTYFRDGDVLLAKITPSFENGKLGIASDLTNGVGFGSSEFFVLRPSEELSAGYLYHFLNRQSFRDWAKGRMTGAVGHKRVPKELVEALEIPLPTLEEQKRIVAVLDEAFEGLAHARTHAEVNLQNGRELFESALEAALERAGGEPMSLQEMMDTGMITSHLDGNHGSDYPRKAEFVSEGVPYISANCIVDNEIDFGRCKYLTPERANGLRKGIAEDRDVLFAHNATVGPVTLLKTEEEKVILSTSLTYYRCNEEELIPEFLVCEMRSAGFRRQYEAVMAQATRNQVPITMQRTFTHMIPPLAQQQRIAELGLELQAKCSSAVKAYETATKDFDDLRQSLLQKAFAGELTRAEAA